MLALEHTRNKPTPIHTLRTQLDLAFSALTADATRLFHGRGHCYPGLEYLNVDWFDPVIWVVLYGDVPEAELTAISAELLCRAEPEPRVQCVALQRRERGRAVQELIYGALPEQVYAREDGAVYQLNLAANQNIGFFLDARPARQWLRERAAGKTVLNLFAYTCSFSVAALQSGAEKVVNIDMAKSALATGQRNHALNGLDISRAVFLPHDIFRSTRRLEDLGPYELVIIDPPSRQKGSFEADKDYVRLLGKLAPMLAPGADILACLNAPYLDEDFLPAAFAGQIAGSDYLGRLLQRTDFPERDLQRCLKMQWFRSPS